MDVYCSVQKSLWSQAVAVLVKCSVLSKFNVVSGKKCNSYGYKNKNKKGRTLHGGHSTKIARGCTSLNIALSLRMVRRLTELTKTCK
jgi:hypothetical protein